MLNVVIAFIIINKKKITVFFKHKIYKFFEPSLIKIESSLFITLR